MSPALDPVYRVAGNTCTDLNSGRTWVLTNISGRWQWIEVSK